MKINPHILLNPIILVLTIFIFFMAGIFAIRSNKNIAESEKRIKYESVLESLNKKAPPVRKMEKNGEQVNRTMCCFRHCPGRRQPALSRNATQSRWRGRCGTFIF